MLRTLTIRKIFPELRLNSPTRLFRFFSPMPAPLNLLAQNSPDQCHDNSGAQRWKSMGDTCTATITWEVPLTPHAVLNAAGQLTGTTSERGGLGLFDVSGPGDATVITFSMRMVFWMPRAIQQISHSPSSFNNNVLNPNDVTGGFSNGCQNRHRCLWSLVF